jgi:hypothetical protein
MKYVKIPYHDGVSYYEIHPYKGALLQFNSAGNENMLPKKVSDALHVCEYPYLVSTQKEAMIKPNINLDTINKINRMHDMFMSMGNNRYYISLLYSRIRKPLFSNTGLAFTAISNNIDTQIERRNELCLQRSLLAMKTSKTFKKSGVLFIGASLPTGRMHAWVIESNCNPDMQDREWIMYRPLIAYYY